MEEYPRSYVAPVRPLVVFSGLSRTTYESEHEIQRNGPAVSSESPVVTGPLAQGLLDRLYSLNKVPSQAGDDARVPQFTIKACGRRYTFPCTKANPRPSPVASPLEASKSFSSSAVLHSPLSPLSPGSPVYPDGLLTPLWAIKYHEVIPSVFVSFFAFGSYGDRNTSHDDLLKDEISRIKSFFDNSGYRTRFAAVLVGDESALDTPDIDERLENIRRGARLEDKSTLFVIPSGASPEELSELADSLLVSIQPLAMEFYRELARHARRKRDKGYTPPQFSLPDGRVQATLSASGWTTRYEYKLGLFAEYRNEWDVACKSYANAIDGLFEANGLLQTVSCWSPRWNELRLFADTCTLRILRCLLRHNQSSVAVRRWRQYRIQIQWLLNERGKGTMSYGWSAWESQWAKAMAELIRDNLNLPITIEQYDSMLGPLGFPAYLKTAQSLDDRPLPWDSAHHAGYWFILSSELMRKRRERALSIPESDRLPPGQSPATSVARRNELYDTYMCPEPHLEYPDSTGPLIDHTQLIIDLLGGAVEQFRSRRQDSLADWVDLKIGAELMQQLRYRELSHVLKPIWRRASWAKARWWDLSNELIWTLHKCSTEINDVETTLATQWDLLSKDMPFITGFNYDLKAIARQQLEHLPKSSLPVVFRLSHGRMSSPITADFLFETDECYASETIRAQLIVVSNAHPNTPPINLSSIIIRFSGNLHSVELLHSQPTTVDDVENSMIKVGDVQLREKKGDNNDSDAGQWMFGDANLGLQAGQTRVYTLSMSPRVTGSIHLREIVATIQTNTLKMDIPFDVPTERSSAIWYCVGSKGARKKRVPAKLISTTVLPRQPRMDIIFRDSGKQYFTNENAVLEIELVNNENEGAEVTLDVQILGDPSDAPQYAWNSEEGSALQHMALSQKLEKLETLQKILKPVLVQMPSIACSLRLQIHATYRLASSPESSIVKAFSADASVVGPFEANYELSPAVHPEAWPSYFDVGAEELSVNLDDDNLEDASPRLLSRWKLKATKASFATENLIIRRTELSILKVSSKATCTVLPHETSSEEQSIATAEQRTADFTIDVRSLLEPRTPTEAEAALVIHWRRTTDPSTTTNTTTLAVPTLALTSNEPRILVSASPMPNDDSFILECTFENPSMHLLALSVSLDPSGEYAFGGPKLTTLQLLPISRHTLRYVLQPLVYGVFVRPVLKVMDTYFKQVLRPMGTGRVKSDTNGILVWVDPIA